MLIKLAARLANALAGLLLVFTAAASAADRSVTFTPTSADILNPERGFYRFGNDDFAKTTLGDLDYIRGSGSTMVYGLVRLDPYRATDIPASYITELDKAFALLRRTGLKIFVRFVYNYPGSSTEYANAKDAPLNIVLNHINQLKPLIARNKDVIVVMNAGFIGAWGEGHTSSNGLDSAASKKTIIKTLLAAWPQDVEILWRYPQDVFDWRDAKLANVGRVGLHNDCFLSSSTDVGTYSEVAAERLVQRKRAMSLSSTNYYMGETCDAQPQSIRKDCASILREGAQFHVSSLDLDYYEAFIKSWTTNGCMAEVKRKFGYRLQLVSASLSTDGVFSVTIDNKGWARPVGARRVRLHWNKLDGSKVVSTLGTSSIRTLRAGSRTTYKIKIGAASKSFCLAVPDWHASLAADPRYAVRFANANVASKGQSYNPSTGRFCFTM
jgi:hypothetical protein